MNDFLLSRTLIDKLNITTQNNIKPHAENTHHKLQTHTAGKMWFIGNSTIPSSLL
jgi:hypothetical protein